MHVTHNRFKVNFIYNSEGYQGHGKFTNICYLFFVGNQEANQTRTTKMNNLATKVNV